MIRVRRRRRSRRPHVLISVVLLVLVTAVAGGWWLLGRDQAAASDAVVAEGNVAQPAATEPPPKLDVKPSPAAARPVALASDEQVILPAKPAPPPPSTPEAVRSAFRFSADADAEPQETEHTPPPAARGSDRPLPDGRGPDQPPHDPTTQRAVADARTGHRGIDTARRLLDSGRIIEARHQLNALLAGSLSNAEQAEVRGLLTRIADDTIFSPRRLPDDPLVDTYVVQPGDRLLHIGRKFDVPYEILMTINGIPDASKLRANQPLKVPRGPFHARLFKSQFRLDVYLGDLYVRSFRVGLGAGDSTPEGVWRVRDRLPNPTYYPPASAPDKRIIPPNDPTNPLGKHWIGLEGTGGDAKGREGYGLHGTIEPESIGKTVSLGCVRLHNEDVAFLYQLLLPGRSTVTILP